eukprot:TRINITY_DN4880_c0_g1_i9.p1 TRINITY_DN4880_c0_g1~~TRINITY_DN4880_c0_g1_i9.p1  ORF type:complete len:211 (+),score=18.79 TRINITY_DN4880_c0_g1_i9:838-1470(+)
MAQGRTCSSFSKVLLFSFVLIVSFASGVTFWKKEGQCTFSSLSTCFSSSTSGVENLATEDKDEVEKYEHTRMLISSSMASKLQGISTDVVEMTNEHPVSFAVSQPEHCLVSPTATAELLGTYVVISHLFIIIVALVFDQMISRHYKKVQRYPSPQVEPSPSRHELKNLGCSKRACFRCSRSRGLQFLKPERDCLAQKRLQILKQQILLCH